MSSLSVFSFQSQEVRVVLINQEPWWIAKDVCDVLGIENHRQSTRYLDEDEKGVFNIHTPGGNQEMLVVNEPGLYSLVLRSRKPQAKVFKRWLTHEVIPSIRRTGSYSTQPQTPKNYLEALKALVAVEEKKMLLEIENRQLVEEVEHLSEAVDDLFDYSSIIRVAKFNNTSEKTFNWRMLKAASKALNIEIKQVPCPRYGTKNLYSHDAWRYCYPEIKLPETTTLIIRTGEQNNEEE